jgi:hypothetical protein
MFQQFKTWPAKRLTAAVVGQTQRAPQHFQCALQAGGSF